MKRLVPVFVGLLWAVKVANAATSFVCTTFAKEAAHCSITAW